jgi:glucose/arabinose dehydrogenase
MIPDRVNNVWPRSFRYISILLVILYSLPGLQSMDVQAESQSSWPAIFITRITGEYENPVHITHPGDNSNRLFIVEQRGRIRVIENNTSIDTYLDIADRVRSPFNGGGSEEGLLSVAFPPGFGSQVEHFYVFYSRADGDNQVSRFSVSSNPKFADADSETPILTLDHPVHQNHNGGQLTFGKDGYLYISTGDGGGGGNPGGNSQDSTSLLGKLLRIDPEAGINPYQIPESNPFVGVPDHLQEIWALGLRNPWRISFDRLTGDMYIGDVGQSSWEEINFQPASSTGGQNYGWNTLEGFTCYNAPTCDDSGMTYPVYVYPTHSDGSCSITGGYVYRGVEYPGMMGIYIYADYCNGKIWGLREADGMWENQLLLDTSRKITTFGEDESGNLYFADTSSGLIYQLQEVVFIAEQYLPIINN